METRALVQPRTKQGRRFTYNDLQRLPDDRFQHEIIDGVHYMTPAPVVRHQDLLGRLHLALGGFVEDRPDRGRVFLSRTDVVFSLYDVVEPDLVFIAPDQLDALTVKYIQGAPALVIEILSPSTRRRDLGIKRALYDKFGVREYWIVDPTKLTVTVYRRERTGAFALAAELTSDAGSVLETPLIPGFSLPLSRLFR